MRYIQEGKDLSKVRQMRSYIDEEVLLCIGGTFEVAETKLKELENWRINKVYDEVDDEKQSSISVRWVLTEKMNEGKTRVKA